MTEAYQKLGRYRLTEEIATGGMAVVYRAKLVGIAGFEKEFAVKRILPEWSHDESFAAMLVQEAKILVHLNHDNIVQVFELGQDRGDFFVVMEFVDGFDLKRVLTHAKASGKSLPPELCCYVAREICLGLEFAHERKGPDGCFLGLVHRDISPQNVLVSREGGVKITDFGIAKIAGKTAETRAGTLKGKFSYMSPEQAAGRNVDARTDVFALGAVLYEMFLGKKCFDGENDLEILDKARRADVTWPGDLPAPLARILGRCLARDKSARYFSVRDVRRDLEIYAQGLETRAEAADLKAFLDGLFGAAPPDRLARESGDTAPTKRLPEPVTRAPSQPDQIRTSVTSPTRIHAASAVTPPPISATVILEPTVQEPVPPTSSQRANHVRGDTTVDLPNPPAAPRINARERGVSAAARPASRLPARVATVILSGAAALAALSLSPGRFESAHRTPSRTPSPAVFRMPTPGFSDALAVSAPPLSPVVSTAATAALTGFPASLLTVPTLPPAHGLIRVAQARPWGTARVAGYGQKPVPADFRVKEGEHRIVVESATPLGKRMVSRTLTVKPDQTLTCTASFAQPPRLVCR